MTKVSEVHPSLYHYTTGPGLLGILESQQLHATNIAYLNDSEEFVGYLTRRLPTLLDRWALECLPSLSQYQSLPAGELDSRAKRFSADFQAAVRAVQQKYDDPYVISFSAHASPKLDPNDGLLSLWRGYGAGGGYAIVFNTAKLQSLLALELGAFYHQFLALCNVDYNYHGLVAGAKQLPETIEDENKIKAALEEFIRTSGQTELDSLVDPLTQLCLRTKHAGFEEESEVRIVSLRSVPEVWELAKLDGERRSQRDIFFRPKGETLVPYLKLFGHELYGQTTRLPIDKIIVGPHPEQSMRFEAVERLRQQYGLDAKVFKSSIPYLPS